MSAALSIAKLLAAQGYGVFAGSSKTQWSINVGEEPDTPDKTITVYDTGGAGQDTDEMDIDDKNIQIRVRAHLRSDASEKISAIRAYLATKQNKESEGRRFFSCIVQSDAAEIGKDDKKRFIFTINYRTLSNEV